MNIGTFLVQLDMAVKAGEIGNLETALDTLGREGLSMVDLYSGFTVLHSPGELLSQLNSRKIGVSSMYHLFKFDYSKDNILKEMREDTKKQLELCAKMETGIFMPVPKITGTYTSKSERELAAKVVSEYMRDVTYLAKPYNITVVVENFSDNRCPFSTVSDIDLLLSENPNLYYTLDTGNFWFNDVDTLSAAERYQDRIRHVHFKDITPSESGSISVNGKACESNEIGSGIINFPEIIDILNGNGYNGTVSIEINTATELFKKTERSISFLKNFV